MRGGASLFDLQKSISNYAIGRKLENVTGVVIHAGQDASGNEKIYSSGNSSGYVLEFDNEMGTQAVADSILASLQLRGFRYQPYKANGAMLDPSAEIGDAVKINGTVSMIGSLATRHSRLMAADISAPYDEEVDHEFKYVPRTQREFKRESAYTRARLTIAEDSIEAKVSRTGGNASSFGWILTADNHVWYADNTEVMRVDRNGLTVKGRVEATSGVIGGCTIENGVLKVGSANVTNLSIGSNFSVDSSGNMTANNAKITGTLTVGGNQITAANLYTGAYQSSQNYGSWNGAATSTSAGGYCYGGAGYGYNYGNATTYGTSSYQAYFYCGQLNVMNANGRIVANNEVFQPVTVVIPNVGTYRFLGRHIS